MTEAICDMNNSAQFEMKQLKPYKLFFTLKGRVHCFSMQFVILSVNLEKNFYADSSCRFREKGKNAPLISKNDVTEPKARLL